MTPQPHRTHRRNDPDTVEALRFLIVHELHKAGWSPEAITGFIVGQRTTGVLRDDAPKWLRASAGFLLAHGKGIEPEFVETVAHQVAGDLIGVRSVKPAAPGPLGVRPAS